MRKLSYKQKYTLASIPFLGMVIALFISWFDIYRSTKSKKYVLAHYLLLFLPLLCVLALFVLVGEFLQPRLGEYWLIVILVVSLIACLGIGYLSVFLEQKVIEYYNKKTLN